MSSSRGGAPVELVRTPTGEARTRVLLADDQEIFLEKLVEAIDDAPDFVLIGTAQQGNEALTMIREQTPDVAVVEPWIHGLDGMALLTAIDRDELETRVVLLSAEPDADRPYEAIGAGASCYLTRQSRPEEIRAAIAAAAAGGSVFDDLVHPALFAAVRQRGALGRPPLDPELRRILELTAGGLTPPQVAERMGVSHTTIKSRLRLINRRLDVTAPTAAVAEAVHRDLIDYPVRLG